VFVIIVALVTIGSTRSAIHADFPAYSASRVHKAAVAQVVIQVITIGRWRRDSSTYLAASKAR
jgi:hypothetical protein